MEYNKIPIKKSWGQNFILDKNTINKIIKIIDPLQCEHIIEVGPGKGALTFPLVKKVKHITAIEIDPLLVEYLNNKKTSKLTIKNQDILNWEPGFKGKRRVVGNLPYYIASPIIFKLIENKNISDIIIMIQKELAQRIASGPNSKDYSRMSVVAQAFCDVTYECNISRNIFNPKPKVDSAIIKLTKKDTSLNFKSFSDFIKKAFIHRRKKLKNNLKDYMDNDGINLIGDKRPEEISVLEYKTIFNKISF